MLGSVGPAGLLHQAGIGPSCQGRSTRTAKPGPTGSSHLPPGLGHRIRRRAPSQARGTCRRAWPLPSQARAVPSGQLPGSPGAELAPPPRAPAQHEAGLPPTGVPWGAPHPGPNIRGPCQQEHRASSEEPVPEPSASDLKPRSFCARACVFLARDLCIFVLLPSSPGAKE